jgi:hypothetical protein
MWYPLSDNSVTFHNLLHESLYYYFLPARILCDSDVVCNYWGCETLVDKKQMNQSDNIYSDKLSHHYP